MIDRTSSRPITAGRGTAAPPPEVGCPFEVIGPCETQIGAERVPHGFDEPVGLARLEAVFPPDAEDLDATLVPVDPWFDPADEAVAEEDREHVPAPAAFRRREEALPHEFEVEELRDERCVPQQGVERGDERDGGTGSAAPGAA